MRPQAPPPAWNPLAEVRWTILSEAAPEQCADRLREQIAPWFPWWTMGGRRFRGRASEGGFRLYARPHRRHYHRLEAVGRFDLAGGGTRIRVSFHQERRMVWLSTALVVLLAAIVVANWASVVESYRGLPIWQLPAIVVLVPAVVWIGHRAQTRVDHDDLRALRLALVATLSAREELPEDSPS
ncbi:MAG TPA: hypothetical protein VL332_08050 [Candidatus Saccharimonadaceae bacterium]|nr:hypothetical protein [Candidatus Saccharimonadaceae bacterium]